MKCILIATDLTGSGDNALARSIRLAAQTGAALHIVHALNPEASRQERLAIRKRLTIEARLMVEELLGRDLDVSIHISSRQATQVIPDLADRIAADLIVLGGHGEPRLRDAIFGTTATHVARHGERPVLVVQGVADALYARVLIAVEDVEDAGSILAAACSVAPQAEIFGVHAFDPSFRQVLAGADALDGQLDREEREIELTLAAAVAGRPKRVSTKQHAVVEAGDVLSVLMKETEALKPDLVAMGTHRRSGFLGSYAVDTLFCCPQDLLIIPERRAEQGERPSIAQMLAT